MRVLAILCIGFLLLGPLIGAPVLFAAFFVVATRLSVTSRIERPTVVPIARIALTSSLHLPRASLPSAN